MSETINYEELGEISDKMPLESLYEAMLPILKTYGLTAEFPADKPSLDYSINGIEFDVLIGESPNAIRYMKYQESPYRNGGIELLLESDTLVHSETNEKLSLKLFITDYISGMTHANGVLWLTVNFRGSESDVEALKTAIAPVLADYKFHSRKVSNSTVSRDKSSINTIKNTDSNFMTNNVNFDQLAQKVFAPDATSNDNENLFAATFSLDAWFFIADAEFQYKMPYCAPFKMFDDAITLTVFTDSERARKFIAEGGLKGGAAAVNVAPEDLILRISTVGILDFFDKLAPFNIAKIFFNPNKDSHGFHHDLKMMRPIYEHLKNKNLLSKTEPTADENAGNNLSKLIEENADVIADFERENEMFSSIIAGSAAAMDEASEADKERIVSNTADMFESVRKEYDMSPKLFRFFIEICLDKRKFLMPAVALMSLPQDASKLEKLSQDGELTIEYTNWIIHKASPASERHLEQPVPKSNGKYYSIFQQGSVKPDFSFALFFEILIPLLENYRGTGEFTESFSPGTNETDMSDLVESFTANAHGDYLKMKFYTFRRNGVEPPLNVKTFGSNLLKNVKTGERLLVRFTLHENPSDSKTKLIVNLLGSESEVLKIYDALKPTLDNFDYKILLETKGEPQPESLKLLEDDVPETITENNFQNNTPQNKDFSANADIEEKSAAPDVDFDVLSKKAMTTNAREDLNALFGAAFALPKWNFISRGELPNVYPYVASNAAAADNQPMIRAFTDTDRLLRFARENNLTEADGSAKVLTMPTETIIPYLEGFIEQGAYGVWFNSDSGSSDFYVPIKQLQPIKDHLEKIKQTAAEKEFTALLLTISDGLSFPSGTVKQSTYNCNFFCWIPRSWTENLQLKNEYLEKLYEQFYGANWRAGNSDGSRYVVIESNSAVISPERIQGTDWSVVQNNDLNRYWFYIGETNGTFRNVTADEFKAQLDSFFQNQKQNEARKNQDNLAGWGISETPNGSFDQNLNLNQVGTVNFETSIAPFYEAIVPLLKDFQGTGEYVTLLRFEESGKSERVENIAENAHGAYLQIRRFLYLNPKNGVRIGVNSVHSNRLRRVQSNAELIVSIELCKNLDNQTAVFYHRFQGPRTDVLNLAAAIQPILDANGYQAVQ